MLDGDQIAATTVYDRDSRAALGARAAAEAASPPACLPDGKFDIVSWSNGQPLSQQLPVLRGQLVGEFDLPDPEALARLARLYIRFGFGAEAEALLAGFAGGPEPEDRALLVDMARAVEGRPAAPDGPLAAAAACPGPHGLWQALGGAAPAWRDAATFVSVQAAFQALPPDVRALVGPSFAARLIDAGHPTEARVIYDTTVRPGERSDAALELVGARLAALDGHPAEAAQAMAALVETGAGVSVEALRDLVRLALDEGMAIPKRTVTDLGAAALQYRGAPEEPVLQGLLAEALARRGDLPAAVAQARHAAADLPEEATAFDALAVRLMAEADPAAVGPAAYAGTVLDAADPLRGGRRGRSGAHHHRPAPGGARAAGPGAGDDRADARGRRSPGAAGRGRGAHPEGRRNRGAGGARAARRSGVGDGQGARPRARRRLRRGARGARPRRHSARRGLCLAVGRLGGGAGSGRGRCRARGDGGLDGGAGSDGARRPQTRRRWRRSRLSSSRCRRSTGRASARRASSSPPDRRSEPLCKASWRATDGCGPEAGPARGSMAK